jgi:hypothetical protein
VERGAAAVRLCVHINADTPGETIMHHSLKALAGACALAAAVPAVGLAQDAPKPGPGVPRGQIEASQYTVEVTGSHAVARHERTRQWLTANSSHVVVRKIPSGKLRFEGATSPARELRFDAASNTLTVGRGSKTPPYLSHAQEARLFARSVANGCYTDVGDTTFAGRSADVHKKVPATSGPCRSDVEVGQAIVDKATGTILQRTDGEADGSFTQVTTLEFVHKLRLDHKTKKLLAMKPHHGAKIVVEKRSKTY